MEMSGLINEFRHCDRSAFPRTNSFTSLCARWRKIHLLALCTFVVCLSVLSSAGKAAAQIAGAGSIQGVVKDSSGALIPNAAVTLTEAATHVALTAKTNSAGNYAFPNINVGTYALTVSAAGFETFTSTGNVLEVGSSIAINPKMTIGREETTVEVRADGVALQTEDASFKQTIDGTEMTEMPLNGRNMTSLITLAGGAQSDSVGDATGSKYPTQTTTISVAGAQGNTVSYRLDGGDNNDYMGGGNGPLPFPDAIGQFSVETAALGAQQGNEAGGLVNIVTRSGTNSFHGSAFEFIRNNFINASDFFSATKDTLHQNQYGGTFGGPILRNKLFAFAAFQHTHSSSQKSNKDAYVPTAANLAGDWSQTDPAPVASGGTGVSNNCGPVVQLYDPISGALLPGNRYNYSVNGLKAVPLPQWNASALALIKQLPAIDPAQDPSNCGHVKYSIPNVTSDNEFDTRVDYTINKKNNFYARYFLDSNQIPSFYSPTNILLTTQSGNPEIRWQSITIGENYVLTSSLVNSLHLTGVRRQLSRGFNPDTPNLSAFGIKDYQAVASGLAINCSTKGANHCSSIGGSSNLLATINDNIPFDISDDLTWIHGKHQFVFGGAFVRNQLNVSNGYQANGVFTIDGTWSGKSKPGDANLDLLQGAVTKFAQSNQQQNALRGSIPTLYVQDTFHATSRLTMTAGLRWQPLFFPHDYFHRGGVFDLAAFQANRHSIIYPNAPAGMFFYGDDGVEPAFTRSTPWQFNPNLGLTYDLSGTGKTVFRAGAAYAYDQPNFFAQQRVQQNQPFSALVSPNTSAQLCLSDPWLVGGTGDAGCGQTGGTDVSPFPQPDFPTPAAATFPQQSQYVVLQSSYKMPVTMQWTASIQQSLPHGWNAQVFYTGNQTQHQLVGIPLSPAVYTPGVWGPAGTGCGPVVTSGPAAVAAHTVGGGPVGTPCSVNAINQNTKIGSYNNELARLALTEMNPTQGNYYSGSTDGSLIETNSGYGNYHGVTVTVQHRFSSTFNLLTNYTLSKCLNNANPHGDISGSQYSNPNNPAADYGPCGSDVRHNFNFILVLKSAFALHGVRGYLVNNWEFAPLVRLVSGTPFTVNEGQDQSFTDNGGDRANLIPGINPYKRTKIKSDPGGAIYADRSYLNQAAFTLNTVPGAQGTISRNSFRNPIYFQDDAQVSRSFPIHDQYKLTLRLEAFNVLNHPSFNGVKNGGPTFSGTFGEITGTSVNPRIFQGVLKITF